jgi:protein arginine kinase activator
MRCESCGEDDASVHLTQLLNGEMKKFHLCKDCAAKHGINVDDPVSLADLLFHPEPSEPASKAKSEPRCAQCHMRLGDFKKASRLGCPACYTSFSAELEPLLLGLHKRPLHTGKRPAGVRLEQDLQERTDLLSKGLKAAIAAEHFEEAARLRDEIKRVRDDGREDA